MIVNPFEVTKAVDFTDEQIADTWVDIPGGGYKSVLDPTSPMPRFLVGGKGGGRTHLLRYFSYPLQKKRHADDPREALREEAYIGIYMRCSGLNAHRFAGKGIAPERWDVVFAYWCGLWMAQLTLEDISDALQGSGRDATLDERAFAMNAGQLFADSSANADFASADTIDELLACLRSLLRDVGRAVANAALSGNLPITLAAIPERLIFDIPKAAQTHFATFANVKFVYLIDEFENLTLPQQVFFNTLIREKELPTSFLVGSRRFGLKTHSTLSAGEENRPGSEFELITLEDTYDSSTGYDDFCRAIFNKRLLGAGVLPNPNLDAYFVTPPGYPNPEDRASTLAAEHSTDEHPRPWLTRLRQQLTVTLDPPRADEILALVTFDLSALHEKFGLLLLYRAWADGKPLLSAARDIQGTVAALHAGTLPRTSKPGIAYSHYRHDLLAQIVHAYKGQPEYYGLHNIVNLSGFLPRNFLILLKQITRWARFLGEEPFTGPPISLEAQREGILEASDWFAGDAKGLGRIGEDANHGVRLLGTYLQAHRLADKPVEVSCAGFSTDRRGLSPSTLECMDDAVSHGLLIEANSSRRGKNTGVPHYKYRLNPMLVPRFHLPATTRGYMPLGKVELECIFGASTTESGFASLRRRREREINAPFDRHSGSLFEDVDDA